MLDWMGRFRTGGACVRGLVWGLIGWFCLGVVSSVHAQTELPPLRVGVLAFRGIQATRDRWEPTRQALQDALPRYRVELDVRTQPELDERVAAGQLDFVLTQPEHYVLLRSRHGLAALATLMSLEAGQPVDRFGGVVFVRTDDARLRTLRDVRGQRVAAVLPHSLGGHRMQQWELFRLGIRLPQDVVDLVFTGQPQDKVVQAVLERQADVGFVRTGVLEAMQREGRLAAGVLRVLPPREAAPFPVAHSTDLYPEWPFSATRSAPDDAIKVVTLALLNISPQSKAATLGGYFGFSPPGDYTPLEAMLLRLGAHPDRSPDPDWRDWVQRHPLEVASGLSLLVLLALAVALGTWWLSRRHQRLGRERSLLLQSLGEGVYGVDARGVCTFINPAALQMLGLVEDEVLGQDTHRLFHYHGLDGLPYPVSDCPVHRTLADGQVRDVEDHLFHKTRGPFPVRLLANPLLQAGVARGAVVVFSDITERQRQEAHLRVAATALETLEGICITDHANRIVRVNKSFTAVTGYAQEEVLGLTPAVLSSGRHDAAFYKSLWATLAEQGSWQGEVWNRRKNGEVYPEWLAITVVKSAQGQVTHHVATFMDISQRKHAEAQIESLAFYDPLTQLPNRRLLQDRLLDAVHQTGLSGSTCGVLFIDLDDFKRLNDAAGHQSGDLLLQEVALRLRRCVGSTDRLARTGGDEFTVLVHGLSADANEAAERVQRLAETVRKTLSHPYQIGTSTHHTSPSIGVVLFGRDDLSGADPGVSVTEILRRGDMAMYQAKAAGGNAIRFFDPDMQVVAEERARMEADLRSALDAGSFALHYQLQFDSLGHPVGAEALARWSHTERGWVPPGQFIAVAERSGLIVPLGQWVLEAACQELARWQKNQATQHWHMAVNISARQFVQPDFEDIVARVLAGSGVRPQGLKLEITESLLLNDMDACLQRMQRLRTLGVTFSLDDFGTGYASLSYLQRLPVDQLKIDASFVRRLPDHAADAAIAGTIISMGHSLGLTVVAEGVETTAQRDWLTERGCALFQGYLLARPQPSDKLF